MATPENHGPGRPKSAEKRGAILEAAKHLFLSLGYDGTSVELIASEAGVSKLTVYNHFTDKETLFFAAVEARCEEQLPDELFRAVPGPIDHALHTIAIRCHDLLASPESIALHRMMISDPRNAERLGNLFWNAGPARVIAALENFFTAAVTRGELDIPNTREAAGHFLCLLKSHVNSQMLCGPIGCPLGGDVQAHIESSVRFFLRAYRPLTHRE